MGAAQSQITYSVPVPGTATTDSTPIYRAPTHPDELVETLDGCQNAWELFQRGKNFDPEQPCLGLRPRDSKGEVHGEFEWKTYAEVERLALNFGTNLMDIEGCMELLDYADESYGPAQKLRPIGIFAKNRMEWFLTEFASNAYNWSIVPLYDTLGTEAIQYMIKRTEMHVVAASREVALNFLKAVKSLNIVKFLIVFCYPDEAISDEIRKEADEANVKLLDFSQLLNDPPKLRPICPGDLNAINTICFTSGTTGNPKGVLLTHRNVVSTVAAILRGPVASNALVIARGEIYLSYLPLAHVLERAVCNTVITIGGQIGCYSGDTHKLLEDVKFLRPTAFVSVPRVFNRINDAVFKGIGDKNPLTKFLFQTGLQAKLDGVRVNAHTKHKVWDALVFHKTRELMGNRLRIMISGGAPLDPQVQENIKVLFCAALVEGYGLTETFGATFIAHQFDPVAGHVGGIIPADELRLVSVPEMNYSVNDNPPRGEIQLRGNTITPGFFRGTEETRNTFTEDGWFMTGDVGVVLPDGALKIVDRKKNIFKLAQGEYVAPEKIEATYQLAAEIAQIFLFGYSDKNHLVGIVIPDMDVARKWAQQQKIPCGTDKELNAAVASKEFRARILQVMEETGKSAGLKGFEKVKHIAVHTDPFSIENGLLTPTLKIKRHEARNRYQADIDALYAQAAATGSS